MLSFLVSDSYFWFPELYAGSASVNVLPIKLHASFQGYINPSNVDKLMTWIHLRKDTTTRQLQMIKWMKWQILLGKQKFGRVYDEDCILRGMYATKYIVDAKNFIVNNYSHNNIDRP